MMSRGAEESLLALLEAMLTLAAQDIGVRRPKPAIKPGGYPEEIFVDLTEEEKDSFSCSICYQILKDAMQCENEHKFCHSCLFIWSTTGQYANRVRCPVCRGPGHYYRNKEVDEQVAKKKVRCHLESCRWVGPLLQLGAHRHTTYDARVSAEEPEEEENEYDSLSILELPYLGRAPPRLPHRGQTRFTGTGLTARLIPPRAAAAAASAAEEVNRSIALPNSTSVMLDTNSPGEGTVNTLLRDRRSTNGVGTTASGRPYPSNIRLPVRQHVSPIRRNGRITVSHVDDNNNQQAMPSISATTGSVRHEGFESGRQTTADESGFSTPRMPRPPSGPPPANPLQRRNLPAIASQRSRSRSRVTGAGNSRNSDRLPSPPPSGHGRGTGDAEIPVPDYFNATAEQRYGLGENLTEIRDRLQESRRRLNSLVNTFSGELERSRQEMVDFQMERERQRRDQLTEVRELGRRLGQVASELRQLLDQRRSSHFSGFDD